MNLYIILAFALDWIVRIGALFIIPKNRKPSSSTAWLMLIFFIPFFGWAIFLLLGSPKLNKRRRKMQDDMDKFFNKIIESEEYKYLTKFIATDIPKSIEHIAKLTKNLGSFPVASGNSISAIDDYYGAIESIAKDIKKAERYVHIEYFIFCLDDATEILFKEMEAAVNRGVKVRLLYDAFGSKRYPNFKEMKNRLTKIGVEWHPMLPIHLPGKKFSRPDLRNHRKIVVIDGDIGYTGSQNLVTRNYHRKDELYYDELVVKVEGPVVMQLEATFITDWYSESGEILQKSNYSEVFSKPQKQGDVLAQVLPSGPGFNDDNNLKLFTTLIHEAKERIIIANPYFVPDDSLITAITSAAQRDVEVIMINSDIMDQKMVGYAQRSYYEELLRAGVKLYLYEKPILLHSKFMTIDDDIAVIGSSNLDIRSFQLDLEVTLLAYNSKVTKELNSIAKKYLKRSNIVNYQTWLSRPLLDKLFENLARLTSAIQ